MQQKFLNQTAEFERLYETTSFRLKLIFKYIHKVSLTLIVFDYKLYLNCYHDCLNYSKEILQIFNLKRLEKKNF